MMGAASHPTAPSTDNPAVAASWRRSQESGLNSGADMEPLLQEVNLGSRLFRAAQPVLDRIRGEIHDARLSVMLVDREARMLTTVDGCRETSNVVTRIGALPGAVWREETTGTNALATPFETRQPLFVRGREHYVDRLKDVSCYGAPIRNPVNGRLEGVLDIMCEAGAENGLMRHFIDTAIADIQTNMRRNLGLRSGAVLEAFESAAKHPAVLVVALSRSMVLQSPAAAALLTPTDIGKLMELTEGRAARGSTQLELANGQTATLDVEAIGESDGALVRIRARRRPVVPRGADPARRSGLRQSWIAAFQASEVSGLIVGEAGTGRTRALREAVQGMPACWIDAGRPDAGEDLDARVQRELACTTHRVLVIDELGALPERSRRLLGPALKLRSSRILATAAAGATDLVHSLFPARMDLPPLRACRSELLQIIDEVAAPGVRFRFTAQAKRVLEAHTWPGNLHELTALLAQLAPLRGTLIDVPDLPAHLRARSTVKSMTPWQRASCDAIVSALQISHGNKAQAAEYLGISRNTLYHHIREYGIIA